MEVIVPAAGLSSRFPGMKPKYLLHDFENKLMLEKSIRPYIDSGAKITIGILKKHDDEYGAIETIKKEIDYDINFVIIPKVTKGPADTVYQILKLANISDDVHFLVKDCDSFFFHFNLEGNYICTANVDDYEMHDRLSSKSFVVIDNKGNVSSIVEKKVISDIFCVGGYKFNSVKDYKETFESLSQDREVFVSDVISKMISNGHIFTDNYSSNYVDVGTSKEWLEYNKVTT